MSNPCDPKSATREICAMRELTKAQKSLARGPLYLILRAALATMFMYLVFLGYQLMGIFGVIFVTGLFLIAAFVPVLGHMVIRCWTEHRGDKQAEVTGVDIRHRDETPFPYVSNAASQKNKEL